MKKVRLAIGVAGVLPTVGLMAQPAVGAREPGAEGKTVRLIEPHVPGAHYDTGCAGSTKASTGSLNSNMHFWWTRDNASGHSGVCIGTVVRSVNALGNPGGIPASQYLRVRIYPSGSQYPAYSHHSPGHCSAFGSCKIIFSDGVHQAFSPKLVQVCTTVVAPTGTYGTLCIKVP